MKISELTNVSIDEPNSQLVIELPSGQRISTNSYRHDIGSGGQSIIIIKAGRKLNKGKKP